MQPGCRTGFAYCPDAVKYGRAHGVTRISWEAEPGDIVLFDWNGNGDADDTEIATSYQGGVLFTIRGNRGPTNIDSFHRKGGVHRHRWEALAGPGKQRHSGCDQHLKGLPLRRLRPPAPRSAATGRLPGAETSASGSARSQSLC
jgi:hypothetical protein